jgi:hypothetical protein
VISLVRIGDVLAIPPLDSLEKLLLCERFETTRVGFSPVKIAIEFPKEVFACEHVIINEFFVVMKEARLPIRAFARDPSDDFSVVPISPAADAGMVAYELS